MDYIESAQIVVIAQAQKSGHKARYVELLQLN